MEKIGIIGIGTKIPKKRLSVDNTINIWKNVSPNYVKGQLGVNMRSVLDSDEDLITLSVEAAKNCLSNANYRAEDIMSIALGTCTDPDLFNSNATMVMNSNFAHRFCLCTLKIQYLAGIRLSKFTLCPMPPEAVSSTKQAMCS